MLKWSSVQIRRQNLFDAKLALNDGLISNDVYNNAEKILIEMLSQSERDFKFLWGTFFERWLVVLGDFKNIVLKRRMTEVLFAILPRPFYLAILRLLAIRRK